MKNKTYKPYYTLSFWGKFGRDVANNKSLYIMFLPVLAYYIAFHYKPMYGALIAFTDYVPGVPIWENIKNDWVGLKNFADFFKDRDFTRVLINTIVISITSIIFAFPAPIILALLLNELKNQVFSRVTQTISYLPHFISLVVICGMIRDFTRDTGVITQFLGLFGLEQVTLLSYGKYFLPIYIISGIWQEVGYGSIIYLAALTGISQELYEAARIDGANKWQQTLAVTLPGIAPTIMTMLILRLGNIMNVGFEKIMLLYNTRIYNVSEVISTLVYRKGIQEFNFSYSAAVGLFNSVINLCILLLANYISKKSTETGLW